MLVNIINLPPLCFYPKLVITHCFTTLQLLTQRHTPEGNVKLGFSSKRVNNYTFPFAERNAIKNTTIEQWLNYFRKEQALEILSILMAKKMSILAYWRFPSFEKFPKSIVNIFVKWLLFLKFRSHLQVKCTEYDNSRKRSCRSWTGKCDTRPWNNNISCNGQFITIWWWCEAKISTLRHTWPRHAL